MTSVEVSGPSVDEAVSIGLIRMGLRRREVSVEVLREEDREQGVPALVRITVCKDKVVAAEEFLQRAVCLYGLPAATVHGFREEETVVLQVRGEGTAALIGHHGRTLDALQHLTNAVATRLSGDHSPLSIDASAYREHRRAVLERLASKAANEAVRTGRDVELEAMPAHERRIIHMILHHDERVTTDSHGQEPHRAVVVHPVAGVIDGNAGENGKGSRLASTPGATVASAATSGAESAAAGGDGGAEKAAGRGGTVNGTRNGRHRSRRGGRHGVQRTGPDVPPG